VFFRRRGPTATKLNFGSEGSLTEQMGQQLALGTFFNLTEEFPPGAQRRVFRQSSSPRRALEFALPQEPQEQNRCHDSDSEEYNASLTM
jgi:hypothetical protein